MKTELRWLNGRLQMRQQNFHGSAGAYGGGGGTYPVWSDWQDVPEEYVYVSCNNDGARGAGGAPMSLGRLQEELDFFCSPAGTFEKLASTPEGAALIRQCFTFIGGYADHTIASDEGCWAMLKYACAHEPGNDAERIENMCYGALFALRYSMIGRVK